MEVKKFAGLIHLRFKRTLFDDLPEHTSNLLMIAATSIRTKRFRISLYYLPGDWATVLHFIERLDNSRSVAPSSN